MGITQKQLAEEANVSLATVSLALNGSPIVAQKTRERIRKLALKHNYQPNLLARSLAGGSSKFFGVLVDSHAPQIQFLLVGLIEREAAQYGYRVMVAEAHDSVEHLAQMRQNLSQYGADGIICLAHDYPGQEKLLELFFKDCRNLVFVGRPQLANASYINIDRAPAIRQAIFHLHEQGYRHIGMTSNSCGFQSDIAKTEAFLAAHRELGTTEPEKLVCRLDAVHDPDAIEKLFAKRIQTGLLDALLCNSDVETAILSKFLQRHGVRVPDDFGLVGFDDEAFCQFTTPELSSINDELHLQARHAVRMLLDILAEKEQGQVQRTVTVRCTLVLRESSCRRPSTEPPAP